MLWDVLMDVVYLLLLQSEVIVALKAHLLIERYMHSYICLGHRWTSGCPNMAFVLQDAASGQSRKDLKI